MSKHRLALISILLVSILWGTAGITAKVLLSQSDPYTILFYRFGLAFLIVLPFFIKEKKPKNWYRTLLPMGALNAANAVFFYMSMARTTVSSGAILGSATPLLVAVLSAILIGEYISKQKITGIITGLAGVLIIVLTPLYYTDTKLTGDFTGNIFFIISMICFSLYIVWSRQLMSEGKFSPLSATAANFLMTALIPLLIALITGQNLVIKGFFSPGYLSIYLYAVIFVTVTTFFLFQWAVKYIAASTAALKDYIQFAVGVWIGIIFLGDELTGTTVAGTVLILAGLVIATGQKFREKLKRITY